MQGGGKRCARSCGVERFAAIAGCVRVPQKRADPSAPMLPMEADFRWLLSPGTRKKCWLLVFRGRKRPVRKVNVLCLLFAFWGWRRGGGGGGSLFVPCFLLLGFFFFVWVFLFCLGFMGFLFFVFVVVLFCFFCCCFGVFFSCFPPLL